MQEYMEDYSEEEALDSTSSPSIFKTLFWKTEKERTET